MRRKWLFMVSAVLILLLLPALVSAGGIRPKLGFSPGFCFLPVGQTTTLDVRASSVVNLYGGEFVIQYDPTALEVLDADPNAEGIQIVAGEVFVGTHAFVALNAVNDVEGRIHFAATLLEPAAPMQGSAVLAHFTVRALRPGPVMLRFSPAYLVDSQANMLDVSLLNGGLWLGPIH
jgi:hypothetical protein